MPAAARSEGNDSVFSLTGVGLGCGSPVTTTTGPSSSRVFINGIKSVRRGDQVGPHNRPGCTPDTSVLTSYSSTVFFDGLNAGRLGDQYTGDNTITSGSPNVFIGG
jgi:uncharacterized Zn-binding protein involved in type VI secretion